MEGGAGLRIPDIPEFKPPIESVAFGGDGRLWVGVSLPSVLREGEWTEPKAYDVFEPDGRYKGRVPVLGTFYLYEMRGDQIWGVFRGEFGEESIRRYRIRWR